MKSYIHVASMTENNLRSSSNLEEFLCLILAKIKLRKIVVLLLMVCSSCFSQKTVQNQRSWFAYLGQYKISEKWGVHLESQFRFDNQFEQNLQNVFRIGGIYFYRLKKIFTLGFALVLYF